VRQEYGQRDQWHAGNLLRLSAGLNLKNINIKLVPTGVVAGRVTSDDGERLPNVRVSVVKRTIAGGRRDYVPVGLAVSNDLGEYRVFNLPPGKYFVSATHLGSISGRVGAKAAVNPLDTPPAAYQPLYYPNSPVASSATELQIPPGGEATGIDFQLPMVRATTVSGRLAASESIGGGRPVLVALVAADSMEPVSMRRLQASTDAEGKFEFHNIIPGPYLLWAEESHNERLYTARQLVNVGVNGAVGLVVPLAASVDIKGQVRIDSEEKTPPNAMEVSLAPKDPVSTIGSSNAAVSANGAFVLKNAAANDYYSEVAGVREGCYLKSASLGREELLDSGFTLSPGVSPGVLDLIVNCEAPKLQGVVMNGAGRPAMGASVIAMPEGPRQGRPNFWKVAGTDESGRFSMQSLTPGEYRLFALESVPPTGFQDPEFFAGREDKGTRVTLKEKAHEQVQLTVIDSLDH
jgi:hypothetical protein